MAKFVRPDGKMVGGRLRKREGSGSIVGWIDEFETNYDEVTQDHKVILTMTISEAEVAKAGGFSPTLFHGSKVEIRVLGVGKEDDDFDPDVDDAVEEEPAEEPGEDEEAEKKLAVIKAKAKKAEEVKRMAEAIAWVDDEPVPDEPKSPWWGEGPEPQPEPAWGPTDESGWAAAVEAEVRKAESEKWAVSAAQAAIMEHDEAKRRRAAEIKGAKWHRAIIEAEELKKHPPSAPLDF
jgi:hypothetical protein